MAKITKITVYVCVYVCVYVYVCICVYVVDNVLYSTKRKSPSREIKRKSEFFFFYRNMLNLTCFSRLMALALQRKTHYDTIQLSEVVKN